MVPQPTLLHLSPPSTLYIPLCKGYKGVLAKDDKEEEESPTEKEAEACCRCMGLKSASLWFVAGGLMFKAYARIVNLLKNLPTLGTAPTH